MQKKLCYVKPMFSMFYVVKPKSGGGYQNSQSSFCDLHPITFFAA
jgi:hypothetical protein